MATLVGAPRDQSDPSARACNTQGNKSSRNAGVSVRFTDIHYSVNTKKGTKQILHGIDGLVHSKQMLCLLGPSGSGKTSLMQILAKKIQNGPTHHVSGTVLCNDAELTGSQFQRIAGLVTQEDVFNSVLTVKETLKFSSKLKLPPHLQSKRLEQVIRLLQLEKCANTYIGDDSNPYLKGISGGEKRRLSIASEILDPDISVLVLDEPTSGLDAAAALNVVNILRSLADTGITVVATLHQPRNLIMSQFDQFMALADGHCIFYGLLSDYVPYLQVDLKCILPAHESPYDLLLDALNPAIGPISASIGALPTNCDNASQILADVFAASELKKKLGSMQHMSQNPMSHEDLIRHRKAVVGWFGKFWTILHRTFIIKTRDPIVLATILSSAIMMGVIFGVLYWGTYDKEDKFVVLDTQMAVTMVTLMSVFLPYDVTLTFPQERKIFLRERKAGLYSTSVFYFARIIADMPMHIIAASIMAGIVYPMVGLRQPVHLFLLVNIAGILAGASLMQLVGAASKTMEEANILMMLIMMLNMCTSTGFVREVPKWLDWMRSISLMGRIADLAMYFEFRNIESKYGAADHVLDSFGVHCKDDDDVMEIMCILLAIYCVARLLTFLAVKFLHTGREFGENLRD